MEMKIERRWTKEKYTIGYWVDENGKRLCNTMEPGRGSGKGLPRCNERIAAGRYELKLRYSPSNKRVCIHFTLPDNPDFNRRYILCHAGNKPEDTLGCILPGRNTYVGWLSDSRICLRIIEDIVFPAIKQGQKVYVTIIE